MIQKIANIFTVRKQKKYILAVADTFPMWHSLRVCYMVDEIEKMKYHPITLLSNIGVQKLLITTDNKVFIDGNSGSK